MCQLADNVLAPFSSNAIRAVFSLAQPSRPGFSTRNICPLHVYVYYVVGRSGLSSRAGSRALQEMVTSMCVNSNFFPFRFCLELCFWAEKWVPIFCQMVSSRHLWTLTV